MSDFKGFNFPVFAVRSKKGRIINFDTLDEALSFRLDPVGVTLDLSDLSIEVFEYGS